MCFVRFRPRYFTLSAVVNYNIFKIVVTTTFIYRIRNILDSCKFILYSETMLESLVSLRRVLVGFLFLILSSPGFSVQLCHLQIRAVLFLSFQFLFFYFLLLPYSTG